MLNKLPIESPRYVTQLQERFHRNIKGPWLCNLSLNARLFKLYNPATLQILEEEKHHDEADI